MGNLIGDLAQAARTLLRRRAYSLTAVSVLALGIGANTLVFSIVNSVLLSPLTYKDADQLVAIFEANPDTKKGRSPSSPAAFETSQETNRSFAAMAAAFPWSPVLQGHGAARQIPALRSSQSLFRVLGVAPLLGRVFSEADEDDSTVVLSYSLWQGEFGGDTAILGKSLQLSGDPFTVIGVMPKGFEFPPFWAVGARLWAPVPRGIFSPGNRDARMLRIFARLRDGVTPTQAQLEMDSIAKGLATQFPAANARLAFSVEALREPVVEDFRGAILLAAAIVACVLLIAGANVTHLTWARAANRSREMAIRTAIGASRFGLLRLILAETMLVALLGGTAGLALATLGLFALARLEFAIPRLAEVSLDGRVVLATLAVTLLCGLATGFIPAWRISRAGAWENLRSRGLTAEGGRRFRTGLAVAEVAIAIVLVAAAGLLGKSFANLISTEPGFESERLLTVNLTLAALGRPSLPEQERLFQELEEKVTQIPGVERASFINHFHFGGDLWQNSYAVEGEPPAAPGFQPHASLRVISPGALRTLGVEMREGREFTSQDRADSPAVVVVNQALARRAWKGASPVGKRMRIGDADSPWATVVGVATDIHQGRIESETLPEVYFPYSQNPLAWFLGSTLAVRTAPGQSRLGPEIRRTIAAVNPDIAVADMRQADDLVSDAVSDWRRNALLAGVFSVIATFLAAAGLYGLITYLVTQRRTETGVRMALGATRSDIVKLVMGDGFRIALAGSVIGVMGTLLLGRLLEGFLFGVTSADPWVMAGAAALMISVCALASYFPARQAGKIDPLEALRSEAF